MHNLYNRISTTRLISVDRLRNESKIARALSSPTDLSVDDIYDMKESISAQGLNDDSALSREERYVSIRRSIDTHEELKDTLEKLTDNAIVPRPDGSFYELDIKEDVDSNVRKTIIEANKK